MTPTPLPTLELPFNRIEKILKAYASGADLHAASVNYSNIATPGGEVSGALEMGFNLLKAGEALGVLPNVVVEVGQAWRIDRIATTQTQSPVLPASSMLDVTRHSLGGHLATAFSRLFTSNVANVVTVNGAGYSVLGDASGNTNRVFTALGGQTSFPSARILNIYGDRGLEIVTQDAGLRQPGDHQLARIENNSIGNTLGHGSVQISTSLRLYDTLRRLEEGAGTGTSTQPPMSAQTMLARFGGHLRSGSSDQNRDFEALLEGLSRVFVGASPILTTRAS